MPKGSVTLLATLENFQDNSSVLTLLKKNDSTVVEQKIAVRIEVFA